jgi:alkanesulfonate monooxygenase SsuD/methylene tetrahydromethanopterin reductase-like flavin-dependent oxidoreductase (luciferase family)
LIRGGLLPDDPTAIQSVAESNPANIPVEKGEHPAVELIKRYAAGDEISNEEAYEVLSPIASVIVGDPEACRRKVEGYRDLGIDHLMCFTQIGDLPQEQVLESIRNVGKYLIPHFDR